VVVIGGRVERGNGALGQASHGNRRERENPRGGDLSQPGKKKGRKRKAGDVGEKEREIEGEKREKKEVKEKKGRERMNLTLIGQIFCDRNHTVIYAFD
jgi:hypothetical protein